MNDQINLMSVISMVMKRWWLLVVTTILFGGIFFTVTEFFIPEMYTSTGKLLVSNTTASGNDEGANVAESLNTLNASARLLNTYTEIFRTNDFFKEVYLESGKDYNENRLRSMVTYSALNETEVLQVEVKCENPSDASLICELIMRKAQKKVKDIGSGGSVTQIDAATIPVTPTSPNKTLNTIIGVLIGMILGVLIIIVIELFDTRVKNEDDLVAKFYIPILGVIPDLESPLTKGGK